MKTTTVNFLLKISPASYCNFLNKMIDIIIKTNATTSIITIRDPTHTYTTYSEFLAFAYVTTARIHPKTII